MTSSKCTPSFGYCSLINNINTGWNASILSSLLHKISYDWLLSRRDLYHSWWAISPIYTTVVKDAIRKLQYPYPNLLLYLMLCFSFIPNRVIALLFMLCFSFIPNRVIPLLFNLNNIYLENNQNIQYFKQSKYRQDSETSNFCFYKYVS